MRIVFVDNLLLEQNGFRLEAVLQPHLGLISLCTVAELAGHDALLLDPKLELAMGRVVLGMGLYRTIADRIVELRPDVVGFTSLGCNFLCTLKIARYLRGRVPDLTILLGGPHATVLDRVIISRFPEFDVVVRHEAEPTLPMLLEALWRGDLSAVPGVTYRCGDEVRTNPAAPLIDDVDELPRAAYHKYPIKELGLDWLRVEAGRGCPFGCTFCSTATFFGRRYRVKSAARLCDELDSLQAEYGIRHFSLQHDLFTVNRRKVLEFCEAVEGRGYTWRCSARVDCVDPELLARMGKSGCKEIYFGVETGSPRMQAISDKRLDLRLLHPILDAAEHAGIAPTVSFITGYPQENEADQAATLDLIGSCLYRCPPPRNAQLHLMTPEPGTKLLAEFGDRLSFDAHASDFTLPPIEPDDVDILRSSPDVFVNTHYFQSVLPRSRHLLVCSTYYAIYDLSPAVLAYLLDQFDGRLSRLIDAVGLWAAARGISTVDHDHFVQFAADRWGATSHLTSLVRYMFALSTIPRRSRGWVIEGRKRDEALIRGWSVDRALVLSSRCSIVTCLHDGSALLAELEARSSPAQDPGILRLSRSGVQDLAPGRRGAVSRKFLETTSLELTIESRPPIELAAAHARPHPYHFVIVARRGSDEVINFLVDEATLELLELFRTPKVPRELLAFCDDVVQLESHLRALSAAGVLVAAQDERASASRSRTWSGLSALTAS